MRGLPRVAPVDPTLRSFDVVQRHESMGASPTNLGYFFGVLVLGAKGSRGEPIFYRLFQKRVRVPLRVVLGNFLPIGNERMRREKEETEMTRMIDGEVGVDVADPPETLDR